MNVHEFSRPPKPSELTAENFSLPKHASNFCNGFCIGRKQDRIGRELHNELFHFTKAFFMQYHWEKSKCNSLTNNTELIKSISSINLFMVPHTLLEEMETEIAFQCLQN